MITRERIGKMIEKWYILEPLFFLAWSTHRLEISFRIKTIRINNGFIEYNPEFMDSLSQERLEELLSFEMMRIILKHPYERKKPLIHLSYLASNITIQEHLQTKTLGIFGASYYFQERDIEKKHFEFYYQKLAEKKESPYPQQEASSQEKSSLDDSSQESSQEKSTLDDSSQESSQSSPQKPSTKDSQNSSTHNPSSGTLKDHAENFETAYENAENWDKDDYLKEKINACILETEMKNSWGKYTRNFKEQILATLKPKIDYRTILHLFRKTLLSTERRRTRMKLNRRYGFLYMGSRYDFSTKLLFAVDVSGSINSSSLRQAFSIINRFFKYGIQEITVICFDTEIKGKEMIFKKARNQIKIQGRGGTSFQPVIHYIEEHPEYDGAIIYTDGDAPQPTLRKKTVPLLWLFESEEAYQRNQKKLKKLGLLTFLKEGA